MQRAPPSTLFPYTTLFRSTFQSVSGAGETGRATLQRERGGEGLQLPRVGSPVEGSPFSRRIAGNVVPQIGGFDDDGWTEEDRKSTRLNSSHGYISYAVFCL